MAKILTIRGFQLMNAARSRHWHRGDLDQWSLLEWCGAMCGEAGEAANFAKKLKRIAQKLPNKKKSLNQKDVAKLEKKLAAELADTIIYAMSTMSALGVDAQNTIVNTFNKKSREYGFKEFL